ncbi:c-type cytochrome [Undibacterium sp. TJN25]|uniref:c-type cytochrome n=1 Tax=Undibacterium sp. TJN25 TaxID=3413056 RepID=UPI003BF16233
MMTTTQMRSSSLRWLHALVSCIAFSAGLPAHAADAAMPERGNPQAQLIKQGEYLARAGDCVACHSSAGGKPFAGGLAMATPVGKVYSSNITPDKEQGIGSWSFEDFDKLMRTGVSKRGYTVYPAMPYPSYSRLSVADMQALYAYFMQGVQPDPAPNKKADIPWPLSMRFPLTWWRWAFAPRPEPYQPATAGSAGSTGGTSSASAQLLRGAYLVQGLGHCGACHTARGLGMQEKALTEVGNEDYLAGGTAIDGWSVPSLRNEHGGGLARWSAADIAAFLKTGRNTHSASFGAMNDVVAHSMQYMSDEDLASIAGYLKSLSASTPVAAPFVADDKIGKELFRGVVTSAGAQIYLDRCAGCHRSDGKGYSNAFPALAGNAVLQSADPTSAINVVLSGGRVPATVSAPSALAMAPYSSLLNDEQVAQVVSFIQTSWGNQGSPATVVQVKKIRSISVGLTPLGKAAFAAGRADTIPAPARTNQKMERPTQGAADL